MDSITNQEKIKMLNAKIDSINKHILWLNVQIETIEDIRVDEKPTMREQLDRFIASKAALQKTLDDLI